MLTNYHCVIDEILVNAADNFQRDKTMDMIKVEIDSTRNLISVWNNGKGIPIQIHKEHNCYVPEMIFGKSQHTKFISWPPLISILQLRRLAADIQQL